MKYLEDAFRRRTLDGPNNDRSFSDKEAQRKEYDAGDARRTPGCFEQTISKWETGKCMPDYSVIEPLCKELEITVAELLDGEEKIDKSVRIYDDVQILELLKRTQKLEDQKTVLYGMLLMVIGLVFLSIHFNIGGSNVRDFVSGVLLGLSIFEMLAGIYIVARGAKR